MGMRSLIATGLSGMLVAASTGTAVRGDTPAATALVADGTSSSTPWVASSGRFVAVVFGGSKDGKADVYAIVSRDGGRRFADAVRVNAVAGEARLGGEFPPRVVLTPARGDGDPGLAVLWTSRGTTTDIKLSRSDDGGRSFAAPVVLQAQGAAGDRGWQSLAADPEGAVHAAWLDHRGLAVARTARGTPASHGSGSHDPVAMAVRSGFYFATAGGPEREISKSVCYCCKTALAAGPGGLIVGAWRHVYPGSIRDIAVAVSRDGGRTFTPPARVSDDGWAINGCPDDGPAVAVDGSGTIHVAWPTVLQGTEPEGAIFYAASRDGVTFTPRLRIPTATRRPTHPQLVVLDGGRVAVAWDERRDGRSVASLRVVSRTGAGQPAIGPSVAVSPDGDASYPVLAATDSGVVAVWTTGGPAPSAWARVIALPR
jgi:hypothetical protein